jgi:hypothetical protein
VIGTTSSEISDQLRDRYSICKCCLNVATYINGKFTMGKLKSSLLSQSFVFDVCITPGLFNLFKYSNSTVCHAHADIPWNPSALLQQNIPISRKQILAVYFKIILIELMYIVFEHCHLFVFDSFITR